MNLETGEVVGATILNISGRGMQLRATKRMALSTPVRVNYGDTLLLGDVCYCSGEGGAFLYGIKLAHTLLGSTALASLMKRMERESRSIPVV